MNKFLYTLLFSTLMSFSVFGADYYWVGGSGNWSDINHWRTSSGGTTLPNVVPGPTDNVYFDVNSGFTASSKTITVNVIANCRNITFDGSSVAPTIMSGSSANSLNIYGSSVWQRGMEVSVYTINYKDTEIPKTITSNGVVTGRSGSKVYFDETSSIDLLDDFKVRSYLYLQSGTWNTNNFRVDMVSFMATSGKASRTINLGSSDIYINDPMYFKFDIYSESVILNAGTSHIHFLGGSSRYPGVLRSHSQVFHDVSFEGYGTIVSNNTTFNRVELKAGGVIGGNNTFNELIFSQGWVYQFNGQYTQTVKEKLLVSGIACGGWTTIESLNFSGSAVAIISMPSGAIVDITSVIMSGIEAKGEADFVANSSIDNGGNSGWTFVGETAVNLYWVGGSGKWSEASHWAATSGGAGGACVPGPSTNVFFDGNSGFTTGSKTVTIDAVAYCRDITFAGSSVPPSMLGADANTSTLNISGSSVWQNGMTMKVRNINYRDTGIPKTITSNGVKTAGDVHFYETSSISLLDDFNMEGGSLYLQAGTWNTNNFRVDLRIFDGIQYNSGAQRAINLGSSEIYLEYSWRTDRAFITLNAGTSHIHIPSSASFYGGPGQVYYNVSFEHVYGGTITGGTLDANLMFNRVEFMGTGSISRFNTFNELILSSAKQYKLQAGSTQTVKKRLSAGKACGGWTSLQSLTAGSSATISMPASATVDVEGLMMQDITAIGDADFIANGSVDNGGNSGWTFPAKPIADLYWVGGAGNWNDALHWATTSGGTGGACVPGSTDNVFFDVNSGFTANSKTITIDAASYCRNITFSGADIPPTLTSRQSLDIYGSSVWQSGMTLSISNINYQDTGTPKTIVSNGVTTTSNTVRFYETSSVSLLDNLIISIDLYIYAGVWNTNNFRVDIGRGLTASLPCTINLGSSDVYLNGTYIPFSISSQWVTLNAGTSHIHFTGSLSSTAINGYDGQVFHNVTFENSNSTGASIAVTGNTSAGLTFNRVEFRGGGSLLGNHTFNNLLLLSNKGYTLKAGSTQTIKNNLTMSGTPCDILSIKSQTSGTQANLNVLAGNTDFNFVNMKDINASGLELHFGKQSTIANQNNTNVTFEPYDPGSIDGLGSDWLCHLFDDNDSKSYILSASGFFGNEYTKYSWTKLNDPDQTGVLGTSSSVDLRSFGYGKYKVDVTYSNGVTETCKVSGEIEVKKRTDAMEVSSPFEACNNGKDTVTLSDVEIEGENVKWYETATSTTELPATTTLVDGSTYYVTQTKDGCESIRSAITVELVQCNAIYINPGFRLRVQR